MRKKTYAFPILGVNMQKMNQWKSTWSELILLILCSGSIIATSNPDDRPVKVNTESCEPTDKSSLNFTPYNRRICKPSPTPSPITKNVAESIRLNCSGSDGGCENVFIVPGNSSPDDSESDRNWDHKFVLVHWSQATGSKFDESDSATGKFESDFLKEYGIQIIDTSKVDPNINKRIFEQSIFKNMTDAQSKEKYANVKLVYQDSKPTQPNCTTVIDSKQPILRTDNKNIITFPLILHFFRHESRLVVLVRYSHFDTDSFGKNLSNDFEASIKEKLESFEFKNKDGSPITNKSVAMNSTPYGLFYHWEFDSNTDFKSLQIHESASSPQILAAVKDPTKRPQDIQEFIYLNKICFSDFNTHLVYVKLK